MILEKIYIKIEGDFKILYKIFSCKFEGVEFFGELFFSLSKGNFL